MALFYYKASYNNDHIDGEMEAADELTVIRNLNKKGYIILEISEKVNTTESRLHLPRKISKKDLIQFTRQLQSLIGSGVSVFEAVSCLCQIQSNKRLKHILEGVLGKLKEGHAIHSAFQQYSDTFQPLYISMVKAGEETGRLDEVLIELIEHMEHELDLTQKIIQAVRYPAFLITVMLGALVVLNIYVVPAFMKLFKSLNTKLPTYTQNLIDFNSFLENNGAAIICIMAIIIFSGHHYLWKTQRGRFVRGKIAIKIPIFGKVMHYTAMSKITSILSLAIKSGVPIIKAIEIIRPITSNKYIAHYLKIIHDDINSGLSIYDATSKTPIFDSVALQMLATGEKSGEIDRLLHQATLYYKREVNYLAEKINEMISPLLITIMSFMLLNLILGVFLPTWELAGSIGK